MSFNLQAVLENNTVLLRPLQVADYEALFSVASDPLIWAQHPTKDRFLKKGFDRFFEDAMASKGSLVVMDKKAGKMIGSSRYKLIDGLPDSIEIGWSFLARNYWGGTYNQAVKGLMINHAFGEFQEVVFFIARENIRSQKAVIKLGAQEINAEAYPSYPVNATTDLVFSIRK